MRKLFLILMAVIAASVGLQAQTRTIHGAVMDAGNNEPLIGATVMPIGGGQGTATDIDGNFTLTVPAGVKKATVSYVGYKSATVELRNGMHVQLESTSTNLDDLVVVAYGTANKESLTGSVAVVGASEIEDRPVTSVTAALEGNAPGVQVNNTTSIPGSSPSVVVRGFNTINGTTAPLYVVDGAIYNGQISDLNPADIESMSVLKDAASCALYGAKGANGVILITTKRAKNVGKVDVTLNISQGMYNLGLPLYERMGANEWMQTSFNGKVNGSVSSGEYADHATSVANWSEYFIDNFAKLNIYGVPNNELFQNGQFVGGNPLSGYDDDLDWWKSVSRTGHRQEYNLSATAATDKYNVFASVGYLKENGYMLKTDFERYVGRINANFQPVSYFRFGVNLGVTQQESNYNASAVDNDSSIENPFLVLSKAPIYPYYAHDLEGNVIYQDGAPKWNTAGYLNKSNPGYTMRMDNSDYSATVLDANVYATAVIPYGFELTVRGVMHRDKTISSEYSNNKWGSAFPINGVYSWGADDFRTHQFQQTLTWGQDYGVHHVDALFNHENYQYEVESNSVTNANQMFSDVYNLANFSENRGTSGSHTMIRSERYLGRVRYNYDQKYFGELSFTREGTSRFQKDNRWGNFWSAGASWIISKEKFMHGLTWLDYLKLRAAYGSVGNDASAGAYAYWSLYGYAYNYGGTNGYSTMVPAQLAANNVKWEATKTFDIGLEGSIFSDRLYFTIGYFDKRNSDLLMRVVQPMSGGCLGFSGKPASVLNNVGTMSNRGWELSFKVNLLRTRDIDWNFTVDGTFIKNKVIKLPYGSDIVGSTSILTEGKSLFEYYTYDWAGVDQLTGKSLYLINPNSHEYYDSETGTYDEAAYQSDVEGARADGSLVEYNGKTYTNNTNYATKEFKGSSLPTVYGSFGTNFSWKGLHVGMLFTYGLGGKTLDSVYQSYMSFSGSPSALHVDLRNSWTEAPAGMTEDSPNRIDPNGVPQLNDNESMNNNTTSSRWLTSSNYLVFKNLNVNYDLPKKWSGALKLQNINIGMSVDNLFTLTARKGMNPQQSYGGGQTTYFGTARVWTFALTARF